MSGLIGAAVTTLQGLFARPGQLDLSHMAATDADTLKEQGNAMFKDKQYEKAIELYSRAIGLEATNAALFR